MDRRLALVAVWALFAAAAVGVGFGAAGLVGDPFTDSPEVASGGDVPDPGASTAAASPTSRSASASSPPRSPNGSPAGGDESVNRSVSTRGGLVSGTCRSGEIRLGAAPAVGWEIDDLDTGFRTEGRVRFERVDDGDGRVEVRASCVRGVPRFEVEDDSSGPGSGGSGSDDD